MLWGSRTPPRGGGVLTFKGSAHFSDEGTAMPETTLPAVSPAPLTALTEDEILFRDNIRQFADEKVRPRVREMDEKGIF